MRGTRPQFACGALERGCPDKILVPIPYTHKTRYLTAESCGTAVHQVEHSGPRPPPPRPGHTNDVAPESVTQQRKLVPARAIHRVSQSHTRQHFQHIDIPLRSGARSSGTHTLLKHTTHDAIEIIETSVPYTVSYRRGHAALLCRGGAEQPPSWAGALERRRAIVRGLAARLHHTGRCTALRVYKRERHRRCRPDRTRANAPERTRASMPATVLRPTVQEPAHSMVCDMHGRGTITRAGWRAVRGRSLSWGSAGRPEPAAGWRTRAREMRRPVAARDRRRSR